jgi:hypothetical protein
LTLGFVKGTQGYVKKAESKLGEQNLKESIERNNEKIKMYDLTDIIEMAL